MHTIRVICLDLIFILPTSFISDTEGAFRKNNFLGFCKFRFVRFELFSFVDYIAIYQLYHVSQIYWWRKQAHPEKNRPVAIRWQTLSHNVASSRPRPSGIRTQNVSGDRWYPTITTMMAPSFIGATSDYM